MDSKASQARETVLDVEQIKERIPHRYPFLMVDRIIEIVPDVSAIGIKNVTVNEPYFQGHFPSRPIMPGVLVIEAMAQTSAIMVMDTLGADAKGKLVYFMSVDSARFRKPIVPGDTVYIHVRKERSRGAVWKFSGEAKVDGNVMAEATYSAMIVDA